MTKFIQIHALTGYSAALVNRDDTGLAKRINFGGKIRTRISSQCQKRAWRMNEGQDAIRQLVDETGDVRTKSLIEKIANGLKDEGLDAETIDAVTDDFLVAVYGKNAVDPKKRQGLLFGGSEIAFLTEKMREIVAEEDLKAAAETFRTDYKKIMDQMRKQGEIGNGLTAALFGRMVTSDVAANVDAAIHVAHAFTVHADRSESDYFTAVDDLAGPGDSGAGHVGDTEVGSGLFYSYVTIDVDLLVSNLGGDRALASEVTRNLVRLIASVSPGAKRGPTAPYGYASSLVIE
ncbi:MAG: type I-E CRISPR-associated protein Cas7/Cse4/CasC, partial [Roseibium sp.]|uniref:type I-E CRISPR-associated protein Cas7/Cse4/CasC n=1 Tax=Roseibium sp. TaxID=1936156 RepID=UPI003297FFE0